MIDVCNLRFTYDGSNYVLKDLNFQVNTNEIVAVMGASGSGKTTLMDIIGGLKKPTRGSVNVCSQDIYSLNENELEHFKLKNMGYIFQQYNLVPFLNVIDNVLLPSTILKKKNKTLEKHGDKLLNALNLSDKKFADPERLSGGERQRVAIARALIMSPPIVLADEPTGALDKENTIKFMEYFKKIFKQVGFAAIIVTHDENVAAYCDRIIRLG